MAKRVFIIHGWDYGPRMNWYPWLKQELQGKGYEVHVPAMPDTHHPKIKDWVKRLAIQVKNLDDETYFIGHSIGCQAIIRYLGTQKRQCGGAIFVGGWFLLTQESTPDAGSKRLAKPWLLSPIPFERARLVMGRPVAILSDNDPYVPLKNAEVFEKALSAKVIIMKRKGHFENERLPIIAKEFAQLAR